MLAKTVIFSASVLLGVILVFNPVIIIILLFISPATLYAKNNNLVKLDNNTLYIDLLLLNLPLLSGIQKKFNFIV